MKIGVVYRHRDYFHYDLDWRDAFLAFKDIDAEIYEYNLENLAKLKKLLRSDVIILLHSVDLAYPAIDYKLFSKILNCRHGKLVYFPRNEFKNFSPKRKFIKKSYVDLVASQLPEKAAQYLYGDLTKLISLPHALNPSIYRYSLLQTRRIITIGSRSMIYPKYLMDETRNNVTKFLKQLKKIKPKYKIDYSTKLKDRFNRKGWAEFLNTCKFTISSETGGVYLDKTDNVQKEIIKYITNNPLVVLPQLLKIFSKKFSKLPSGKCISSRHFEAAGCQTCQILVEGKYNGILKPNIHYIELKKDLSNIDVVVNKMQNKKLVNSIRDNAYSLVVKNHTHSKRIYTLVKYLNKL